MRNWEIKSRSRSCCSCETAFEVGQSYHCLLDFRGEEPVRSDFCEGCWRSNGLAASRGGEGRAYWRAVFRRLREKKEEAEPIEQDIVQRLLDRFIDSEEPAHVRVCFILALLQERKKILLVQGRGRDPESGPYTIYEHRERGDTLVIRDPELTLSEAELVEAEIKGLMENEKPASAENGENDHSGEDREEVPEEDSPERMKDR